MAESWRSSFHSSAKVRAGPTARGLLRRIKTPIGRGLARALVCASLFSAVGAWAQPASAQESPGRPPGQLWSRYPPGEKQLAPPAAPERLQEAPMPAPPRSPEVEPTSPDAPDARDTPPAVLVAGLGAVTVVLLLVLMPLGFGTRALVQAERRYTPSPAPEPAPSHTAESVPAPAAPERAPVPRSAPAVAPANGPAATAAVNHLLLVPTPEGYRLTECAGEAPRPGTLLDDDALSTEGQFVVSRVGPSPLPLDPRRCAFLERRDAEN